MRLLRALACLCAFSVAVVMLPFLPASADDVRIVDPAGMGDIALLDALTAADLVENWLDTSPHSVEASLLEVRAGAAHDAAELELEVALYEFASLRELHRGHRAELDRIEATIDRLDTVIRQLRRNDLRPESGPGDVNASAQTARTRRVLRQFDETTEPQSLSAELDELQRAVAHMLIDSLGGVEDKDAHALRWNEILDRMTPLRSRLLAQRMVGHAAVLAEQAEVERIESLMSSLHSLRGAASTAVAGIPLTTLDTYIVGATFAGDACPVDWALLAGIGRVESIHGTLGEAAVAASGAVRPMIFGPLLDGGATDRESEAEAEAARLAAEAEAERLAAEAAAAEQAELERRRSELYGLPVSPTPTPDPAIEAIEESRQEDGSESDGDDAGESDGEDDEEGDEDGDDEPEGNGFAVIEDSDGGEMDGNDRWDRAVGPMQFLPGTWRLWATDGNGDGVEDPHNLYDAAAGAARYLCSLARRSGPSPRVFILGYNASDAYVNRVLSFADDYRDTLPRALNVATED